MKILLAVVITWILSTAVGAVEPIPLIVPNKPLGNWTFDNGREFPGAVGKLELVNDDDQPTLMLHGDFSGGGQYVQAATRLNDVPLETVSFDIKVPAGVGEVTTRLVDGSGQCHQLKIRLNDKGGWQKYTFPVARYFESLEAGAPMDIVTQYQSWSGADDDKWHQPARLFVMLAGREQLSQGRIAIRNVVLYPTPPKTDVTTTIRLDDIGDDDTGDWQYNNGNEFRGAKGGLSSIEGPSDEQRGLSLWADFRGGGQYVGVRRNLRNLKIKRTDMIRMQARSNDTQQFSIRLNDSAGQTHQRHGFKIIADGKWHEMAIDPRKVAGGEHWGGPNDGQWRGAVRLIEIMLNGRSSESQTMRLDLADIRSDVIVEATESDLSGAFDFEDDTIDRAWQTTGDVEIVTLGDNNKALRLSRALANRQTDTYADSPKFSVSRGVWKLAYRHKTQLQSPDNSFHGRVVLNVFDGDGKKIEAIEGGIGFGKEDWKVVTKTVTLPPESFMAAWHVELNKTYGEFILDDVSATRLEVQPAEPRVESIRIGSKAIGNLFYPGDRLVFDVAVHCIKPLLVADRSIQYSVVDYRGDEQLVGKAGLTAVPETENKLYQASIELPADRFSVGQFNELHVEVSQDLGSPVREFSGFAILPPAVTKNFRPDEIPFTIRNWDSRVREYFFLADRLGIRTLGVWGGWKNRPPYEPKLPGIEIVEQLDAKWITGTPASEVERNGFRNVSEDSLHKGMTNFLEAYADRGLAKIALGNEPHGTGEVVLDNVRAYKAVYEAVKAYDEDIEVVATSVEPNEEYFKAGYQNYCDSYDFHIYEHYSKVRKTMREYRELMRKYDAVKPIHSTELGLNSQGQARLSVAIELVKKCTVFFAEGGSMASWFTIQYPDPQGKARGQFGDAHCVFDCKFNNYNPRLDAVTLYNLVNAVAAKKFVNEKQHANGLQEFHFRDAAKRQLLILWNDEANAPASIEVPEGTAVEVIRIDGYRTKQTSGANGLTVSVGEEPLMLLY